MATILYLILGQCVFAVIVILFLKNNLDKELMRAALESFESCKTSPYIKEIVVRTASMVNEEFKSYFESIRQRKFSGAHLNYQEDPQLKGGVVIAMGDLLLDFSLSSRLQNFWS